MSEDPAPYAGKDLTPMPDLKFAVYDMKCKRVVAVCEDRYHADLIQRLVSWSEIREIKITGDKSDGLRQT